MLDNIEYNRWKQDSNSGDDFILLICSLSFVRTFSFTLCLMFQRVRCIKNLKSYWLMCSWSNWFHAGVVISFVPPESTNATSLYSCLSYWYRVYAELTYMLMPKIDNAIVDHGCSSVISFVPTLLLLRLLWYDCQVLHFLLPILRDCARMNKPHLC